MTTLIAPRARVKYTVPHTAHSRTSAAVSIDHRGDTVHNRKSFNPTASSWPGCCCDLSATRSSRITRRSTSRKSAAQPANPSDTNGRRIRTSKSLGTNGRHVKASEERDAQLLKQAINNPGVTEIPE